jgi:hypothetical protein
MVSGQSTPKECREKENLLYHRRYNFRVLLGEDWPLADIDKLIAEDIDFHDLEKLLNNNCPKELAIKILL